MITPVDTLDRLRRDTEKMTEVIKSFAGMTDEQFEQAIDKDFLHVYNEAKKRSSISSYSSYGVGSSSIAVDHAKAYLPKAISNVNEAKEKFNEAVKPYQSRIDKLVKKREKEAAELHAKKMEEVRDNIMGIKPKYEALAAEIQAFDPNPVMDVVLARDLSYIETCYKETQMTNVYADDNDKKLAQRYEATESAFAILKLAQEGKFDEIKKIFKVESDKLLEKRVPFNPILNETTYRILLASKYGEQIGEFADTHFMEASGSHEWMYDLRGNTTKNYINNLKTKEKLKGYSKEISETVERIKATDSSEFLAAYLDNIVEYSKEDYATISEFSKNIFYNDIVRYNDVLKKANAILKSFEAGKIEEVQQFFKSEFESKDDSLDSSKSFTFSRAMMSVLNASEVGQKLYPQVEKYFMEYHARYAGGYEEAYGRALDELKNTQDAIIYKKLKTEKITVFKDIAALEPENKTLVSMLKGKSQEFDESLKRTKEAEKKGKERISGIGGRYASYEKALKILTMCEAGRFEDVQSMLETEMRKYTHTANINHNDFDGIELLWASKHGDKLYEMLNGALEKLSSENGSENSQIRRMRELTEDSRAYVLENYGKQKSKSGSNPN